MRRINGISDARKISAAASDDTQSVMVIDADGYVKLTMGGATFPSGLTPEQARKIAADLRSSANRVEAEQ